MDTRDRPLDRRQRKSRAALQTALTTLIASKPYENITIENIADAADVTRATFYAHYSDKAALLREACTHVLDEVRPVIVAATPLDGSEFTGEALALLFSSALEHADLYRVVLSGAGGAEPRSAFVGALEAIAREVFQAVITEQATAPPVPVRLTAGIVVSALIYTIEATINNELTGSAAEIAALFMRSQSHHLRWSLGLPPGEFQE